MPSRIITSGRATPAASIFTLTSPGFGSGHSSSNSWISSGPPYLLTMMRWYRMDLLSPVGHRFARICAGTARAIRRSARSIVDSGSAHPGRRRSWFSRSEHRPDMAVRMVLFRVVLPQRTLHRLRPLEGPQQTAGVEFVVGEGERKATAVGQGTNATTRVDEVIAFEAERVRSVGRHRLMLRIPACAQEVAAVESTAPTQQVVQVGE